MSLRDLPYQPHILLYHSIKFTHIQNNGFHYSLSTMSRTCHEHTKIYSFHFVLVIINNIIKEKSRKGTKAEHEMYRSKKVKHRHSKWNLLGKQYVVFADLLLLFPRNTFLLFA